MAVIKCEYNYEGIVIKGNHIGSGIGIPTVNIGDRQKGRIRAASIIDCSANVDSIVFAMIKAVIFDMGGVVIPLDMKRCIDNFRDKAGFKDIDAVRFTEELEKFKTKFLKKQ